jgi:hypothetical protein
MAVRDDIVRSLVRTGKLLPEAIPGGHELAAAYRATRSARIYPCRYEGDIVERCPKNCEASHVRDCSIHDRCTRGPNNGRVMSCQRCPDFENRPEAEAPTPAGPFVRHLLYHIYPVSGNGAWQRNVGRLVERLRLFDGRIVVAIVTDPPTGRKPDPTGPHPPDRGRHIHSCDSAEAVMQAFGPWRDRIEWLLMENDPHLREVRTLVPMLEKFLPAGGPADIALYAQAKATTRSRTHIGNHWSDVQYIVYLDYIRLVEDQLRRVPVTGAFKKLGPGWRADQTVSDWHYSGSWFWVRLADLFRRDWRTVDQFWSGVEPYPSQKFRTAEAACLFWEKQVPQMNLYHPRYWQHVVDPAFEQWRRDNDQWFNPRQGL